MLHAVKLRAPVAGLFALALAAVASCPAAQAQERVLARSEAAGRRPRRKARCVVYGSMNEQEALPYYKIFEDASGVKVTYVRASDTGIIGRIAVEFRANQRSWDVVMTTPVNRLPDAVLAQIDPPQAKGLIPQARDPNRRWYGTYANYNRPPTTPNSSSASSCRRPTRNSCSARNGAAGSPSTRATANG